MSCTNIYKKFIKTRSRWRLKSAFCPVCFHMVTIADFEMHAHEKHNIDLNRECEFCLGLYDWNSGLKTSQVVSLHRLECMKKLHFLKCLKSPKIHYFPIYNTWISDKKFKHTIQTFPKQSYFQN